MTTIEGGTDAASMVLFDPAALPEDFDARLADDSCAVLEEITNSGRGYWLNTQGDGGYNLGVCVADRLPDGLAAYAEPIERIELFHVPSGRLYFAGAEYAFRNEDALLRRYPHMAEAADVPPGVYGLDLYELNYPDGFHERVLRDRVGTRLFAFHQAMSSLVPAGCLAVIIGAVSLAFLTFRTWASFVLPCAAVLIALPFLLARMPAYRRASKVYAAVRREHPDYLAHLRPTAAGESPQSTGHHQRLRTTIQP